MSSTWDKQWVADDGTLNAKYYIVEVDYDVAHSIYNQEPVGDKRYLPATVTKHKNNYVITINDQVIGQAPISWTRLDGRLKQGPIHATADVQWRAYDDPQRFMVKLSIKNA